MRVFFFFEEFTTDRKKNSLVKSKTIDRDLYMSLITISLTSRWNRVLISYGHGQRKQRSGNAGSAEEVRGYPHIPNTIQSVPSISITTIDIDVYQDQNHIIRSHQYTVFAYNKSCAKSDVGS